MWSVAQKKTTTKTTTTKKSQVSCQVMFSYSRKEIQPINQLKRSFNKETFNELHSISLCSWKKKTLLEANNKKKIFQFLLVCCSMNHVNLCKFAASFPSVFAVSCTRICYKNLGKRCSVYVYVHSSFFLFWAVHYNAPWKVYSPQDPVPQQLDSFSCSLIG